MDYSDTLTEKKEIKKREKKKIEKPKRQKKMFAYIIMKTWLYGKHQLINMFITVDLPIPKVYYVHLL